MAARSVGPGLELRGGEGYERAHGSRSRYRSRTIETPRIQVAAIAWKQDEAR